ncbi:MAG: heavy metal-binding domain-containing protein [Clostridiales bacterium]|nr:heavy metal-binding domain-containing protein [Clostridiales bacterium]
MLMTTTEIIPGKEYTIIGIAKGGTIQSKHIGKDIMANLKQIVGGELVGYNEMMNEARALATKRMVEEAASMGADAIVCLRYSTSAIMAAAAEVMAYGTAVKFKS